VDTHERDTLGRKRIGDERQMGLILGRENDGVRIRRQVPRARFTGSMNEMRGLDAAREIRTNDHVMRDRIMRSAALSRSGVVDRSCKQE
jgi:hypothetical protein